MGLYFRLSTRFLPADIDAIEKALASGAMHPRDVKMKLAREIASIFYGDDDADAAQASFVQTFQQGLVPDEMPEYAMKSGETVLDVLMNANLAESKSKARSLVAQKGVRLDGETLERGDAPFPHPGVLQVGKRRFVRVK
jgi:tyrosyl-tRNA synthetase